MNFHFNSQEIDRMPTSVDLDEYKQFTEFYKQWSKTTHLREIEDPTAKFQRPTPEVFVDDLAGSVYRRNQAIQMRLGVRSTAQAQHSDDPYVYKLQRHYEERSYAKELLRSADWGQGRVIRPLSARYAQRSRKYKRKT